MWISQRGLDLIRLQVVCCLGLAACTSSAPSATPDPTFSPTPSATLTVTPTATETPFATPPLWPAFNDEMVLPAPLYYVQDADPEASGSCPLPHIVRLGRVGGKPTQLGPCLIWGGIHGFDVSPVDGSLVIAGQGALWLLDADGNNSTRLIEALPNLEIEGAQADIQDPVWSPDGTRIAYADGGMRVVDVASGERTDIAENQCLNQELSGPVSPCFYGVWYVDPQWSPDGTALLFRSQNADYFFQMLYSFSSEDPPESVPGTAGVQPDHIAWGPDSATLIFDYWWPIAPAITDTTEPAFVRWDWLAGEAEILWSHADRADPVFASAGNNPWQVRYPLALPDGRILFFQAEPCDRESCYKYALAEAAPSITGMTLQILRHNALPSGARRVIWHESGEYIAFVMGSYSGPWYITVMRVSTGEMFVLSEEQRPPSHLMWGNP